MLPGMMALVGWQGGASMAGNWADIGPATAANTIITSNATQTPGAGSLYVTIVGSGAGFGLSSAVNTLKIFKNGFDEGDAYTWTAGAETNLALVVSVSSGDTISFQSTHTRAAGDSIFYTVTVLQSGVGVIDTFTVDQTTT